MHSISGIVFYGNKEEGALERFRIDKLLFKPNLVRGHEKVFIRMITYLPGFVIFVDEEGQYTL